MRLLVNRLGDVDGWYESDRLDFRNEEAAIAKAKSILGVPDNEPLKFDFENEEVWEVDSKCGKISLQFWRDIVSDSDYIERLIKAVEKHCERKISDRELIQEVTIIAGLAENDRQ